MADEQTSASRDERFEILQKLGAGGMGVVYRAFDHERKIQVALKTLSRVDPRALYRFKREFRTLADVAHPNLVSLYELHTSGDNWFFTMELIEGQSFVAHVRPLARAVDAATPTSVSSTVSGADPTSPTGVWAPKPSYRERIAAGVTDYGRLEMALVQLVDGITALHHAGKLHRDIKPSNVLVEPRGRVVLLDFGLAADAARVLDDRTHDMVAVGTPMYMSPEQAANLPLTEASDWYSVGVMLYEALTGHRPFEEAGASVFLDKQLQNPTPPSEVEPTVPARLDALCVELLCRDPNGRAGGGEIVAALNRPRSVVRSQLSKARRRAAFVGRQAELEALRAAYLRTRQGRGATVFLRGESGMGKSALMRRFVEILATTTSALILEGRCYEREMMPFKALDAVIDSLTRELLAMPPPDVPRVLPRDVPLLARLFPVLERVPAIAEPELPQLMPPDPQELRRRAFIALRVMFERLAAKRPVVVYIDDLQWGDSDSARLLADLIHNPAGPALLLVLGYRLEDEATSELICALRKEPSERACDVTIGPLPDDEATALIRELGRDPAHFGDAVRDSGGSPLFLRELARAELSEHTSPGGAPRSLDDLLGARIDALDANGRNLLLACAAAGRPILPELAVQIAGVDGEGPELGVLRADRLVRTRLGPGNTYLVEPYHDRIRAAALATLSPPARAALHKRVAKALEATAAPDPEALVQHWVAAGDFKRAGKYAVAAAEGASRILAFHAAARHYELALEHVDLTRELRRDMYASLAAAQANAGRLDDAAKAFGTAAQLATGDESIRLRGLELEQLLRRGRLDEGLDNAKDVLASVGVSMPASDGSAILTMLVHRALLRWRGLEFKPRAEADVTQEELRRADVVWSVASAMSFVNPVAGRALQMKYMRMALALGEPSRVALALSLEIGYLGVGGMRVRDRVERVIERGLEIATAHGDARIEAILRGGSGIASFLCGRWRESFERLSTGADQLRDHGVGARWELDIAQIFQTSSLVYLGELRELVRLVPLYLREAEERGDVYAARGLCAWRTNVTWLVMDRPDEAEARVDRVAMTGKFHLHHYYELTSRAQISLYRGDGADAWRRVQGGVRDVKRSLLLRIQNLTIEWQYLTARAALASAGADGVRTALACAKVMARQKTPWGNALAALVRGCAHRIGGDPSRAMADLRAAIEGFDAADMPLHGAIARQRLAELSTGEEASALAAHFDDFASAQGVVNPSALARLYAP